jgi:AraC-like DNA-binding protein
MAAERDEMVAAWELVYPRKGVFICRDHRGEHVVDVNHLVVFSPDHPYRVDHPLDSDDSATVFAVGVEMWKRLLDAAVPGRTDQSGISFRQTALMSTPAWDWTHRSLIRRIKRCTTDSLEIEATALALAASVLDALVRPDNASPNPPDARSSSHHRRIVKTVKIILSQRFSEHLTLDMISHAACVSPFHLARLFSRGAGQPLHRYLRLLRLRTTLEPLADGAVNLTQVALEAGFSGHSHFTDAFKAEFGISPSRFREQMSGTGVAKMRRILEARIGRD